MKTLLLLFVAVLIFASCHKKENLSASETKHILSYYQIEHITLYNVDAHIYLDSSVFILPPNSNIPFMAYSGGKISISLDMDNGKEEIFILRYNYPQMDKMDTIKSISKNTFYTLK